MIPHRVLLIALLLAGGVGCVHDSNPYFDKQRQAPSPPIRKAVAAPAPPTVGTMQPSIARTPNTAPKIIPPDSGEVYALLVGVGNYQHDGVPKLNYAASDPHRLREALVEAGASTNNIMVLTDKEATMARVRYEVGSNHLTKAGPEDTVIFYFSGHGAPEQNPNRPDGFEKYLMFYNTDPNMLYGSGYGLGEIGVDLARLDANRVVLVIDSCFAGEVATLQGLKALNLQDDYQVVTERRRPQAANAPQYDEPSYERSTVVIASSRANQVSQEHGDLQAGVFTYYFVDGLQNRTADLDGDGRIAVGEAFEYASRRVADKTGRKQTPVMAPREPVVPIYLRR